jgi:hypothetical protein
LRKWLDYGRGNRHLYGNAERGSGKRRIRRQPGKQQQRGNCAGISKRGVGSDERDLLRGNFVGDLGRGSDFDCERRQREPDFYDSAWRISTNVGRELGEFVVWQHRGECVHDADGDVDLDRDGASDCERGID